MQAGDKYGKLTLIEPYTRVNPKGRKFSAWNCLCDCGNTHKADASNLKQGAVKHCKACRLERISKDHKTHGMSGHKGKGAVKVYYTWQAMKRRCFYPKDSRYAEYGGRGITVCPAWRDSFEQFLADVGEPPTKDHTIERIDYNGNYEPGNVRWSTKTEQANNKRNNRLIEWNGKQQTMPEWCRELNLDFARTNARYKRTKDVAFAFSGGLLKSFSRIAYRVDGVKYETLADVSRAHGLSLSGCHGRFNSPTYPTWVKEISE